MIEQSLISEMQQLQVEIQSTNTETKIKTVSQAQSNPAFQKSMP